MSEVFIRDLISLTLNLKKELDLLQKEGINEKELTSIKEKLNRIEAFLREKVENQSSVEATIFSEDTIRKFDEKKLLTELFILIGNLKVSFLKLAKTLSLPHFLDEKELIIKVKNVRKLILQLI